MNRIVYTYTDLRKLKKSENFREIMHYPQVTVSADLKKAMNFSCEHGQMEGLLQGDSSVRITEFRSLAQALNKTWGTDQCKFNEMIILSEFIRREMTLAGENRRTLNWLLGCMRNLGSLLSTITLLELAEVKPEDISVGDDRNLKLMVDAWRYLAERDPEINQFRMNMSATYSKQIWDPVLRTAFRTETSFADVDKIVFHGFYYITPLQEKIMCLLEAAGYQLIYLIPYDRRYPFVYEIWESTYSEKRGYPPKNQWHMDVSDETDPYGEIFEGKKNVEIKNRLKIREYASVMEFVNDVKHIQEAGYTFYSSDFKAANKLLKDYFPEEYGERKILSYPIGQFVSVLNNMWDEEQQSVALDEESLIECFSSGWLSVDGTSSRQYLQDLIYIMPFFSGCFTVEEWTNRINLLKTIQKDVIQPFTLDLDADESVSRWQEAIDNPLANFSMFSVDEDRLDSILSMIRQLLDMAVSLFGNNQTVRVSDHINKLSQILKRHEISDELYQEESEIIGDIFEKFGRPGSFNAQCAPSDIANALNLFLYDRFEEGEIQTNRSGLINPIYFIDAACIRNNSKVHICMCDVNAMPGGNKEYIWPISAPVMQSCFRRTGNPLIINLMQIMESTGLCNRYFMYNALKNDNVTLSWISDVDDKVLAPSPYIKLVSSATGIKLTPAVRNTITYARVADSMYGTGRINEYDNEKMPSGAIKEARMAYALCPMRYVLGYVVDKFPTYQSEFQQNYALNALISAVYNLMKDKGMTLDDVYDNVIGLFPELRKVEKRQVKDYMSYDRGENDFDYGNRSECGGLFYTDERLKLHYPNPLVREAVLGRYGKLMTPDGRKGMNLYEVMEATNDEEIQKRRDIIKSACMFCPHIDYCRNAIYAGDQENYYD